MRPTRVRSWIAERVPVSLRSLEQPLREELPVHLRVWMGWLGGTPLLLFVLQVLTGILLTFYYRPEVTHAYGSIRHITYDVRFGWLVRGIHRLGAQLMVITVLLHIIRVFVTGAYRRPRELTWIFGAVMFTLTLGFCFTGYSLVYDSLSYWATTVGTNLLASIPLIGPSLLWIVRAGPDVNPDTLGRFYNVHVGVIPTVFTIVLALHIWMVRLHGVARLESDPRRETYFFFPEHVLRETAMALLIVLGLVLWSMVHPPGLGAPADPAVTPSHIRPEWYFYPSYRWLKMVPMQAGIWTTVAFIVGMVFWPWIDAAIEKRAPGRRIGLWLGATAFLFTLYLLISEAVS